MLDTGRAKVFIAPDRTRTCNPQIRSLVPYPLGHRSSLVKEKGLQMTVSELFQPRLQVCKDLRFDPYLNVLGTYLQ